MILQIKDLHKSYRRNQVPVLRGINLRLKEGEVAAIVGKSGSGKSTILKAIAGLEPIDGGQIILQGKVITSPKAFIPPEKRKIGYLFQDFALFPHLTVAKNVGFGLSDSKKRQHRVQEMLELMRLESHSAKYPHELSGGEQQRVALARAMAPEPSLLLLDEPFSNLDNHIKKEIRAFVFSVIRSTGLSCIFVTHDLEDAMEYADTLSILHEGEIEQSGPPDEIYNQPRSPHVAGFFGEINILNRELIDRFKLAVPTGSTCGVRTCDIQCSLRQIKESLPARIVEKARVGRFSKIKVEIQEGCRLDLEIPYGKINGHKEIFISISDDDLLHFGDS